MPKSDKIVYPSGVKEISEEISTDDLVRRLKECAQAFQNMSQDENNSDYVPLALHLATINFMEHASKDVRLLVACCIADVFRVFAPEAPYKDPEHLKCIFEFFIQQLRGLEDPKDATFKRYFYLLENLAWVKSFNICIELEENQSIFYKLFALIFGIVNDNHSPKVKNFMLDMMCPLISEADAVSQELLDIILIQIIEPRKTHNKNAYALARDILKRTASTIEPYVQAFFNNALILGKTAQSEVANNLYDLIYELNAICPSMLIAVLPQLEFKLKSNDERERLEVTRLLARMFSDKNSELAADNKALWTCFLGRFNDISLNVRMRCVQYAMHFLINHPELRPDITEQLRQRQHDPEENVRYEAVMAIISAAKKEFKSVTDELLTFVKERTLDKKFKIRKEALMGLAFLYKQHMSSSTIPESTMDCISWIKNKVLHVYYQTALEDRLLVERILHTCLVPYNLPIEERMKKLYQLFVTVDDFAVKAFNELLKCQNMVRNQVKQVMDSLQTPKNAERDKVLMSRIITLSKNLPEPVKCQEYIKKFCNMLENNVRLRNHMDMVLSGKVSCGEAELSVKEVLKSLGFPVQTNSYYMTIKQMLERVAPVMIDHAGVLQILGYIKDALLEDGNMDEQLGLKESAHRGLQLLYTLSFVFTTAFHGEDVYEDLIMFLRSNDDYVAEITLQILANVGNDLEKDHPNVAAHIFPLLQNFVENGTVKQAKHAVSCLNVLASNRDKLFTQILEHLKQHLTLQSQYYRTALVSIGHIGLCLPEQFGAQIKGIVSKNVVKDLLMNDQEPARGDSALWVPFDELTEEVKVKCEAMKMMVRWLVGLRQATYSAKSTLKLLRAIILHRGDLMEKKIPSPAEKSWLRYTAAASMLKLCQETAYADIITHDQFQVLAVVINDECYQVREKFSQKLHKGLIAMKLPLDFMAVFSLAGLEKIRELKSQFKQYLLANINKRREYLKQHHVPPSKLYSMLPDCVLPYAIHLLAHDLSYKQFDDVAILTRLKECLWFLMEPLILKSENYSFSFFKRLIENIKQTKDQQALEDDMANMRLYAVCDLALSLVISKTTNFVLKDFPVDAVLPSKLFTEPDLSYNNMKSYLPPELQITPPKKSGLESDHLGGPASKARRTNYKMRNSNGNGDSDDDDYVPTARAKESHSQAVGGKRPRGRPRKFPLVPVQSSQQQLRAAAGHHQEDEELEEEEEELLEEEEIVEEVEMSQLEEDNEGQHLLAIAAAVSEAQEAAEAQEATNVVEELHEEDVETDPAAASVVTAAPLINENVVVEKIVQTTTVVAAAAHPPIVVAVSAASKTSVTTNVVVVQATENPLKRSAAKANEEEPGSGDHQQSSKENPPAAKRTRAAISAEEMTSKTNVEKAADVIPEVPPPSAKVTTTAKLTTPATAGKATIVKATKATVEAAKLTTVVPKVAAAAATTPETVKVTTTAASSTTATNATAAVKAATAQETAKAKSSTPATAAPVEEKVISSPPPATRTGLRGQKATTTTNSTSPSTPTPPPTTTSSSSNSVVVAESSETKTAAGEASATTSTRQSARIARISNGSDEQSESTANAAGSAAATAGETKGKKSSGGSPTVVVASAKGASSSSSSSAPAAPPAAASSTTEERRVMTRRR